MTKKHIFKAVIQNAGGLFYAPGTDDRSIVGDLGEEWKGGEG